MTKLIYKNWTIRNQNGKPYSFRNGTYTVIIEKLQTRSVETGFNEKTKEKTFRDETTVEKFEDYRFPETWEDTTDPKNPVTIKLTKPYVLQFLKLKIDEMEAPRNIVISTPDGTTKAQLDTINE